MAIAGCVVRVWCCALFLGVVLLVWPLGDRHAVAPVYLLTHVLFRVCVKRLSLSCGGIRWVSNDTHSNSNSSQDHFYEKSCATRKRKVVICVQVSAAEQSTVASVFMNVWWQAWWLQYAGLIFFASLTTGKSDKRKFSQAVRQNNRLPTCCLFCSDRFTP